MSETAYCLNCLTPVVEVSGGMYVCATCRVERSRVLTAEQALERALYSDGLERRYRREAESELATIRNGIDALAQMFFANAPRRTWW